MIKVLHISGSDQYGGAEQFSYDFVHSSPFECTLLVANKTTLSKRVIELPKTWLDHCFIFLDKVLYKIGIRKRFKQLFSISEELNFTYKKLKQLKSYKEADIIHLHNVHGGYFDLSALEKISSEKPIVWSLHDMWSITGGEAHTFGNKNYTKGIGKTPFSDIYPLNNPILDLRTYYLKKKKVLYKKMTANTFWIPASYWLEECIRASYVFNKSMSVQTIQYGIDLEIFKNNNNRNWKELRILFFNSKSPFKGSDIFLKLISSLDKKTELYIVGNKLEMESNIKIRYFDFITDRRSLANLYNEVDVLVFPSKADTFPFTILEAMACGVCVIGSNVGGITEQLIKGSGMLFENQNSADLLAKINGLNISNAREIGLKASFTTIQKYNLHHMHEQYARIYNGLHQQEREV